MGWDGMGWDGMGCIHAMLYGWVETEKGYEVTISTKK